MEHYIQIRASLKNVLDALNSKKSAFELIENIRNQINIQSTETHKIEAQIIVLLKKYNTSLLTNIKPIKGIGEPTAAILITATNGFKNFESAKQLASYFGLAPIEKSKGTSIKGSRKISKMGNPLVRKKLYMCKPLSIIKPVKNYITA